MASQGPLYRIGCDVGGTNSDAALLDITQLSTPSRGVLSTAKSATTPDITSGIHAAISSVLSASKADRSRVLSVTIGTTHFINALVEADARRLARVAVVRLCGPFTRQLPPFADFPTGLRRIMDGGSYFLDGGLEIDGREIAPLRDDQVVETVRQIRAAGVRAVALVGVFAPLDHAGAHEETVRTRIRELAPELDVVCSGALGGPGLLERENATILNAAILATARRTIHGFKAAMRALGLRCPLYLSQNDGTLIDADGAAEYPIRTFMSGPTNSMTGAAFLGGLDKPRVVEDASSGEEGGGGQEQEQVLIVDIGGTTTDVCALLPSGFPRQAPNFVEVGGVRTAFAMPEVVSIGLGGGSKISADPSTGEVTVGPDSVGHRLTEEALVFGGKTLTVTDIAVASGQAQLGDASLVHDIPAATLENGRARMKSMLESVIDQMKVSAAPVHALLVGGGSVLAAGDLDGVAQCSRPPHHDAANAVGAAIAKVAGEVDVIEILDGRDKKAVLAACCERAVAEAVRKGADREDVRIVAVEKMPLQYTGNKATRVVVKAVGRLAVPDESVLNAVWAEKLEQQVANEVEEEVQEGEKMHVLDASEPTNRPSLHVDVETYQPEVKDGVWFISEVDLEFIMTGTGVLGTGGGGPSYHEFLKGVHALRTGGAGKMRVVAPAAMRDEDLVCFGSWYGAPSVINERIAGGDEIATGIDALNKILGHDKFDALLTDEIGGGNGMSCFPTGVRYDVPIIDGDAMGRAYPTMYHATLYVYGNPLTPCALSDARGNVSVVMQAESPIRVETMLRTTAIELGLGCAVCARPLTADIIKEYAVPNTISQAWYIGRAVHAARRNKTSYIDAIFANTPGKLLFTGKIVDVRRDISGGYTMGSVLLAPLDASEAEGLSSSSSSPSLQTPKSTTAHTHLLIPFQNEYLYAVRTDPAGDAPGAVLCTVPDLISVLGQDGEAVGSQDLRYGLRVSVVGIPAHPLWKTEQGLKVGGPEGFGLGGEIEFTGVGEYEAPRSVIDEFGGGR